VICVGCGKSFEKKRDRWGSRQPLPRCNSCRVVKHHETRDQEGENNPCWVGGSRYYQKGYRGRDKNGLSWKQQRKLCWERDGYKCQWSGCSWQGFHDELKPDCHHKIPYRISGSHSLENLVSYCKSHHKMAEHQYLFFNN